MSAKTRKNNSKIRGDYAEKKVLDYFLERGYQLKAQREIIFGVEFDLILKKNFNLVYIEVKSVYSSDFYLLRWPKKQKQRFIKVASVLSERRSSKCYLALVDYNDRIHLFNVGSEV